MSDVPDIDALLADARALLAFQGELGLVGLDVRRDLFDSRQVAAPDATRVEATDAPARPDRRADPAEALSEIRAGLGDCARCKLSRGRTQIVFGVGDPTARLMFIGEGPGRDEDLQGEPFVGAAGRLLDKMIKAMGLSRQKVYIANIVKCRPPRNRDPEADEVRACEPFLKQQIRAIGPEVIVALGRYAAQTLLRDQTPITRLRGRWKAYEGIPLMPTYHPAYLLRNEQEKRPVWADLQSVMKRLGLPNLHVRS